MGKDEPECRKCINRVMCEFLAQYRMRPFNASICPAYGTGKLRDLTGRTTKELSCDR